MNIKLSYIERLKSNTVPVLRFRTHPDSFEKIKEILKEDAILYRIPDNKLDKNFSQTFNDPIIEDNFKTLPPTFEEVTEVKVKLYIAFKFRIFRG